jgi:Tfp pilus assembly PilM family ATPase
MARRPKIKEQAVWCDHGSGRERIRVEAIARRTDLIFVRRIASSFAGMSGHVMALSEFQLRAAFRPEGRG